MASLLEMQMTGQLGGINGGAMGGGPKSNNGWLGQLGLRDSEVGTLGAISTTQGILSTQANVWGIQPTKLEQLWKNGSPVGKGSTDSGGGVSFGGSTNFGGGGSDVSEVSAPSPSWSSRTSGGGSGGMSRG
jgi:hypothetical protein